MLGKSVELKVNQVFQNLLSLIIMLGDVGNTNVSSGEKKLFVNFYEGGFSVEEAPSKWGFAVLLKLGIPHDIPILGDIGEFYNCFFLEKKCPSDNISFWLYNREIQHHPYRLRPGSESNLRHAPLSENGSLKILIHGYTGHRDYSPNTELRPAYMEHDDYNVITVDWGQAAQEPCYLHAAYNVEQVGQCAVELIRLMYDLHPEILSLERTHVVGFSLGAHVAGAIGKRFKKEFNMSFPRITGLDPALPLFDSLLSHSEYFLDKNDGDFVDVIHTNAGRKGRLYQVGHADFYINNAGIQPGCISNSSCDHVRAVEIFAESVSSETGFWGVPCSVQAAQFMIGFVAEACTLGAEKDLKNDSSLVLMGEYVDDSINGTFLVRTQDKPPYAKGRLFY